MDGISTLFFPDSTTKSLVVVCYIIILFVAFGRFGKLATVYETFDAPEKARPWTTCLRYYSASAVYVSVYIISFAFLYHLFRQYPEFIQVAQNIFQADPVAKAILPKIQDIPQYTYPILSVIALTVGIGRLKPIAAVEQKIRSFFQRLGSIPKNISHTIHLMKRSLLKFDEEECMRTMSDAMKQELRFHHLRQNDEKSFERLYLRSRHLYLKLLSWNNKMSPYYHFRTVYQTQFNNICKAYARIDRDIKRYYNNLIEFRKTFDSLQQAAGGNPTPVDGATFFDPLRKDRAELRVSLKDILENIYTLLASAILSEGISASARIRRLKDFGFHMPQNQMKHVSFADPHDLTLLSLLLFLVVPAAATFSNSLKSGSVTDYPLAIFVIWPATAIWVGFAGVIPVAMIKKQLETSRRALWVRLRNGSSKIDLPAYVMAGIIAFGAGAAGMMVLIHLDPRYAQKSTVPVIPWALLSTAIAIATGLNYDRSTDDAASMRPGDVIITAVFTLSAAVIALFISQGKFDLAILRKAGVYLFALPAAALLGGIVGAIIPPRYRLHKAQQLKIDRREVDPSKPVRECCNSMQARAAAERVSMSLEVEDNLPPLDIDAPLIQMAIIGLLSNAFEYTAPDDKISIKVYQREDGSAVQISVADTGSGISHGHLLEIREWLENPEPQWLYSVSNEIPADLRQIGFIAARHDGALRVDRNEAGGTTATISLPTKSKSDGASS